MNLEGNLLPPGEKLVAFYRRDPTAEIVRRALPAILLMVLGSIAMGWAWVRIELVEPTGLHRRAQQLEAEHGPPPMVNAPQAPVRHPLLRPTQSQRRAAAMRRPPIAPDDLPSPALLWSVLMVGLVLIAAGPLSLLLSLRQLWRRDHSFLLLRTDALVFQDQGRREEHDWYDIESIAHGEGRLLLHLRSGETVALPMFAQGDLDAFVKDLEQLRRKSIFGLLRGQH